MKTVTIYTDGACSGNPGPGGWGAILQYGEFKKELSGGEAETTNNRMELTGVIAALEAVREPCVVELYSDSKYVIDALSKGWAKGWKAKGWIKPDRKPALNPDLWERLLELCEYHTVHLHWVKGHADNEFNNRCDELAVMESQKFRQEKEAEGPEEDEEEIPELERVTERIYMLPGEDFAGRDRPFLYYIRGDKLRLAVDAGNSPHHVKTFYAALKAAGHPAPDITVVTHWHWDHSFGLRAVKGLTLATRATNEELRRIRKWEWDEDSMATRLSTGEDIPACNECICREYADPQTIHVTTARMEIEGPLAIDLGGVTCRLLPQDSPHSRDGLFVYIPEERALAVGDGESGDYYELEGGYAPERLEALLSFLESLDYDLALPGHRAPWTKEEQLSTLCEMQKNAAGT
jgi:ribonuclease HI/glyoxylase-like metal-dependent hydrolase (beta-lactamase superfamily II)